MARIQRDTVISTALELLDEVGIDGLTMRRLAQALEIQAPSLYWHFANKESLLDAMADRLMEPVARVVDESGDWRASLRQTADEMRHALLARRNGARVFAGTYVVSENTLRVAEAMIGPLRDAGMPSRRATWSAFSIVYFVLGFVIEEQGAADVPQAGGPDGRRGAFEALAAGRFPHLMASMADVFDLDWNARFEVGLDLLVAGCAAGLAAACGERA